MKPRVGKDDAECFCQSPKVRAAIQGGTPKGAPDHRNGLSQVHPQEAWEEARDVDKTLKKSRSDSEALSSIRPAKDLHGVSGAGRHEAKPVSCTEAQAGPTV